MAIKVVHRDVESTANVLTGAFERTISPDTVLYDNTLREGEQPPGVVFTSDEKLEIARALDEIGMPWANVGMPAVSKQEQQSVMRVTKAGLKMKTAALCRLLPADIDATVDSGVDLVSLFMAGSDVHLRDKLHMTEADALSKIEEAIRRVHDRGGHPAFTIEDGSRTPLPRMLRMFQTAAEAGAEYLILADTCGVLTPHTTYQVVGILTKLLPRPIGLHFHDDLGLALANSLAGLEAGARMAHVTVNGVGERSGNTCFEEMAVALKVKYGLDLGFKLDKLYELSQLVHKASGSKPSEHKSITGRWCFTHEAGIHVAGVLANPETYQPYPPKMVGRNHEIYFGKHSGAQSLNYLAEQRGLTLTDGVRKQVLEQIKAYAERKQDLLREEQILEWIRAAQGA